MSNTKHSENCRSIRIAGARTLGSGLLELFVWRGDCGGELGWRC